MVSLSAASVGVNRVVMARALMSRIRALTKACWTARALEPDCHGVLLAGFVMTLTRVRGGRSGRRRRGPGRGGICAAREKARGHRGKAAAGGRLVGQACRVAPGPPPWA